MKIIWNGLLLAVLCTVTGEASPSPPIGAFVSNEVYVLNGEDASRAEFPHQLMLERKSAQQWKFICGAVLISDVHALTAAHCVENTEAKRLRITAGLHDISMRNGSQTVAIQTAKIHPKWNHGPETFTNDLAILTLSTALKLNENVKSIPWIEDNNATMEGEPCVLSGWGQDETTAYPNVLQKADIDVISNKKCDELFSTLYNVKTYPGHLCGFEPPKGSCGGDSGGPLTCTLKGKSYLAGITSWNIRKDGYCMPSFPAVFARISYFNKWIVDKIP